MRERDLLEHIQRAAAQDPHILVGPGDDCAVVRSPSGETLLLTVDHLVEGTHFTRLPKDPSLDVIHLIARKAVARSLSDIAAMGGTPIAALATACFPAEFPHDLARVLADALHQWGRHWSCPIVGGDVAEFARDRAAPLVLTTTVLGQAPPRGAILRSGARPGDALYITGSIGDAFKSGRHMTFEPRLREAAFLAGLPGDQRPTAMIDLSDGLGLDVTRLARASHVTLVIEPALVPLSAGEVEWRDAFADGEDYELAFTAPPDAPIPAVCPQTGTRITRIGCAEVTEPGESRCLALLSDGGRLDLCEAGFLHGRR